MRKMTSLLVLAMFILSIVPAAFAHGHEGSLGIDASVAGVEASAEAEVSAESEESALEMKARARTKAEIKERMEEKRGDMKLRVLTKVKVEKARDNFLKAQARFDDAKLRLEEARARFEASKEDLKRCKGDECKDVKLRVKTVIKERLAHQADIIIAQLERLLEKYEGSEDVSEDEEAKVVAYLKERIELFTAIKAKIEAAETKEELVKAAKELRDAWDETKHKLRLHISAFHKSKMSGILNRIEHLRTKLQRVLEKMEAQGKDTSQVEPLVAEFKAELVAAKASFEASQELLLDAKELRGTGSGEEVSALVRQAQEKLKEAREHLQKATELLRKIMHALREQGESLENEADEEESDEEESEDEESEEESEISLESGGNISESVKTAANALFESLKASETNAEITLKAEVAEDGTVTVNQEVEASLSADQQALLDALVDALETATSDVKVEIELEFEAEESEDESEESNETESNETSA